MDRGGVGSKRRLHRPEPGRAVHWLDRRRSRVAEATSRADVLGGQLAEASGWPAELSARAGFLEKTLAAIARARCRRRPPEWRSSDRVAVRGSVGLCQSNLASQRVYSSMLSFTVPDINSAVSKLMALGAELDGPIKYEIHGKVAALRCIDGHMLGLYEPA
uniref:Lactoylglutathione lyase / glyoxalase I family protein n=1 Tax=Zea mays TaxID=4577 RepID=A0A804R3U1_MAIZE